MLVVGIRGSKPSVIEQFFNQELSFMPDFLIGKECQAFG